MTKLIFFLLLLCNINNALSNTEINLAVPGPGNLSYLPLELISKIGADQAAGFQLHLIHTGGGAIALKHLMDHNTEFAAAGLPAQISLRTTGQPVLTIAAIDDAPLFILMVRQDLAEQIKTVADLRGRIIGVNTSSHKSKTTSQQLIELLLKNSGVPIDSVRIFPGGQTWQEQSSLILSGTIDALMGDEPFATRLRNMGKVFFLVNLANHPGITIPGGDFLHAALATRPDIIDQYPNLVAKMIQALQSTLNWIATHRQEQIVEQLAIADSEARQSLLDALRIYPNLYSPDGRFSNQQLRATEYFFKQATDENTTGKNNFNLETQIIDRWVGRKD